MNSVAERWNRMMLEDVRTLLAASELPRFMWPMAMEYTIFIRNRLPYCSLPDGKLPTEMAQPSIDIVVQYKQFLPFRGRVWYHQYNIPRGQKLQDQVFKVRIVSYTGTYRIYRVADKQGNIIVVKNPVPRIPSPAPSPSMTISVSVQTESSTAAGPSNQPIVTSLSSEFSQSPARSASPPPLVATCISIFSPILMSEI